MNKYKNMLKKSVSSIVSSVGIKAGEAALEQCCTFTMYEPTIPKELLELRNSKI